uniref:Uncharacterized protein n=1 Tax=Panagrellus redivivus TaxID=6233 RepID=A0A7E4VS69_PANRE
MESRIPNLRQLRWKLPAPMQLSIGSIMRASNMEAAERHVGDLKKHLVSESETLHTIQKLIYKYLQDVALTKTATKLTKDGRTHMEYTLDSTNRKLVLIVSDRVESPLRFDRRGVQRIITEYLSF